MHYETDTSGDREIERQRNYVHAMEGRLKLGGGVCVLGVCDLSSSRGATDADADLGLALPHLPEIFNPSRTTTIRATKAPQLAAMMMTRLLAAIQGEARFRKFSKFQKLPNFMKLSWVSI